jgi:PAS domain-containing protein
MWLSFWLVGEAPAALPARRCGVAVPDGSPAWQCWQWPAHNAPSPQPPAMPAQPPSTATTIAAPQVQALVSFLEHEAQPMIVLDPDYNILAANTAYQRQFGTVDRPYIGHKCYRISHHYDVPCDQAGEHCPMKKAFELKGPDRVLHIHHTPRGPEHVDVELRPILDDRRAVVAYVERLATVRSASARPSADGLVGRAPAFNAALSAVQRVAPSMLPVLLLGESGTGKELFARAVHEASPRAHGPFVVVDCSGLTETLFESELFGYEKGAFTGATARKPGLVETAKGGTLFLDEMGDVPLSMQVKLLRLIETGTFRRVGAVESQQADFRLVAATHKSAGGDGRGRRLPPGLVLPHQRLPDPRCRRCASAMGDLPSAGRFASCSAAPRPSASLTVSPGAMACCRRTPGPATSASCATCSTARACLPRAGVIEPGDIRLDQEGPSFGGYVPALALAQQSPSLDDIPLAQRVKRFRGTRKMLAQELGWSERTLYRKLKALGID